MIRKKGKREWKAREWKKRDMRRVRRERTVKENALEIDRKKGYMKDEK